MLATIILFFFIFLTILAIFVSEIFGMMDIERKINNKKYNNVEYNTVSRSEIPNLEEGKNISKNKKIVFTGLTRDNSKKIARNLGSLCKIGESFADYRIVIFENDSKDNTREIIESMADMNGKIILLECEVERCKLNLTREKGVSLTRMEKMSSYRNRCFNFIFNNYSDWDYLMVCDLDMESVFYRSGVLHSISLMDEYAAVFAKGLMHVPLTFGMANVPYDGLAYLRSDDEPQKQVKISSLPLMWMKQIKDCSFTKKPINVKSAFNGAGIYRISDIKDMKYNAELGCEHYSLNCRLHEKGKKLCINPMFTFQSGTQGVA